MGKCKDKKRCPIKTRNNSFDTETAKQKDEYEFTYKDHKTIVKIPVVLARKIIEVEVDAFIELQELALEIKNIDRNVYLTENTFIPITIQDNQVEIEKGELFLNGFIRKSISYSTVKNLNEKGIYGEIHHITVNIPFKCTTEIEYGFPPTIAKNNKTKKIAIYKLENRNKNEEKKIFHELNYEVSSESEEIFTEPIFCELEKAKVCEVNSYMNRKPISEFFPLQIKTFSSESDQHPLEPEFFPLESVFQTIKEKMILNLTLRVLQKQPVQI